MTESDWIFCFVIFTFMFLAISLYCFRPDLYPQLVGTFLP